MAISLVKACAAQWQGNGMGTSSAEWTVKGKEYIFVSKNSGFWRAIDTRSAKILVRYAASRSELIQDLNSIL